MKYEPLILCALLLSACGGPDNPRLQDIAQANRAVPADYVVGGDDDLAVTFTYNPNLSETVPVQQDGRIALPMVGQVVAAGQTPAALSARFTALYGPILQRPEVVVSVKSASSQRVYVAGEVGHPGVVPLDPDMTITSAISAAGGLKDSAGLHHVVVLRRDGTGAERAYRVNVASILNGNDMTANVRLMPRDVVFVPKSGVANVNMAVKQFVRDNIPIGVALPL
jgi:protein involved in polysaccharide export with SLBB domain